MEKTAPPRKFYMPELDGLRFFAFLLVFVHHDPLFNSIPILSGLHTHGWIGVDLFFVLSAFLFTRLLMEEYRVTGDISFKKFYIRRIFRIWPIYYLFICFAMAYLFLFVVDKPEGDVIFRWLAGLLTFTDNIMVAIAGAYNAIPFVGHLWTISYEEQFYVIVPLLILFLAKASLRTRNIFFVAVFIVLAAIRAIMISKGIPYHAAWVLPVTHFESILLGLMIGLGMTDGLLKKIHPSIFLAVSVSGFLLLISIPNIHEVSTTLNVTFLLVGVTTSAALMGVLTGKAVSRFLAGNWLVFLGKRSYGLYVYHYLGIYIAAQLIERIPFLPGGLLAGFFYALTATILMSVASYHLIERPFLRIKQRFEVVSSRPV